MELKKARRKEQLKEEKEEKARQKSQADEIRQNTGTLETIRPKARVELRRGVRDPSENEWYKKYVEAANVLPDGPPEMTVFQRLWPSALVGTRHLCCGICLRSNLRPTKAISKSLAGYAPLSSYYHYNHSSQCRGPSTLESPTTLPILQHLFHRHPSGTHASQLSREYFLSPSGGSFCCEHGGIVVYRYSTS